MDGSWVSHIPVKYIYWVASGMAAILVTGLSWAVSMAAKTLKSDRKKLSEIGPKLDLIMNNHLNHIQAAVEEQGKKQDTTNLELAEQTGYLKAIAESLKK
jgi:hypothetical protein